MLMAETWSLWVFVSLISGGRSVGFLRPGVGLVVRPSVLPEGISLVRASLSVVSRVVSTDVVSLVLESVSLTLDISPEFDSTAFGLIMASNSNSILFFSLVECSVLVKGET